MEGTDAVVLMTEWNEYRNMDMLIVKEKLNTPLFIDLRNVYEPKEMQDYGFDYFSVGR